MKKVNLIIVLNPSEDKVLMCHRQKEPYKGKYNFVGGKLNPNENDMDGAYRELFEETGIKKEDIDLSSLMYSIYPQEQLELQVYYGVLKYEVQLKEEINPLLWIDISSDFSNKKFAGDGNIQHMIQTMKYYLSSK